MPKPQTTETYSVNPRYIRAAALCAAKWDVRNYLMHIHVASRDKRVIYAASDGHIAFLAIDEYSKRLPRFEVMIPVGIARSYKPKDKSRQAAFAANLIRLPGDSGKEWIYGDRAFGDPDADLFKDRNVIDMVASIVPREVSGEKAYYNPQYLMAAAKAMNVAAGRSEGTFKHALYIQPNGRGPALVLNRDYQAVGDCVALVMPMRVEGDVLSQYEDFFDAVTILKAKSKKKAE